MIVVVVAGLVTKDVDVTDCSALDWAEWSCAAQRGGIYHRAT